MSTNDFKPFATGSGANVTSQADWEALPALLTGFQAGKASSAQVNKAIRQASFIAAALAQYTANKSGQNVLDDGDVAGFITKMSTAFGKDFQSLDATLTALAALATGANKLPYFTGTDTAGQTDLTQVGRDIIGKTDIASVLTYLGLVDSSGYGGRLSGAPTAITTSGQFTMPAKGNLFRIRVQGAGGGSGAARATSSAGLSTSGGGASGSYVELWITRAQLQAVITEAGGSITVSVGAGGVGGVVGDGGDGGATSFGSLIVCPGGKGSPYGAVASTTTTALANGGTSSDDPTISITGLPASQIILSVSGAPGGFGISVQSPTLAGHGANSLLGRGGVGSGASAAQSNGKGYGSGAGGVSNGINSAAKNGAIGGNGVIILEAYL